MSDAKKITIWDKLIKDEILSADQLQMARKQSGETRASLQKTIIKLGILTEKELLQAFSDFYAIPMMDLGTALIKKNVIDLVPQSIAVKYTLIPVFKIGQTLTVATSDPLNFYGLDQVERHTQLSVKAVLSTESMIVKAIEQYYGTLSSPTESNKGGSSLSMPMASPESGAKLDDEAPVVQLTNNIIEQAVQNGASDIHIEPEEKFVRIRLRVDGVLYEISTPPKEVEAGIISRIKIMAGMNIAEKRKAQDGRCRVNVRGKEVDFRISTIPTHCGENMVIRILDKTQLILPLEKLGFPAEIERQWKELIQRPHGLILLTGPTGSGKTTALYSTLNRLKSLNVNIVTVEDPVEYQLDTIRQMQVNPKMDITFTSGLRSILRQDPDIIMVGEIRDRDTADMAIQAALTGHLVFSTLHTNDAAGTLTRLTEMGIEPFLISSSVVAILAQRLVRVLCPACSENRPVTAHEAEILGMPLSDLAQQKTKHPVGCKKCKNKGYSGRIGVFELLEMNSDLRKQVMSKATAEQIRDLAIIGGMKTLFQSGLEKVFSQVTSLEELLRVSVR